jgi:hypothetical protein
MNWLWHDQGTDGTEKSKRIPSIFNDEITGSFICLRRHIYMSHVNKVQPIRVKIICIAAIRRASLREALFFIESLLSPVQTTILYRL